MSAPARRSLPVLGRLNETAIAEAVRSEIAALFSERPSATDLGAAAFDLYEQALAQVEAKIPPSRPRACVEGCAFCCHLKVAVTPVEVLRVAAHLRRSLPPKDLARLSARVREVDAQTRGMSTAARVGAKVACPLLDAGGRCIAYEARPVSCAGANSFDAAQCKAGFESADGDVDIQYYGLQPRVASAVRAGAAAALSERALDGRLLELVAGLSLALADGEIERRWWRGEPVFDAAVDLEAMG